MIEDEAIHRLGEALNHFHAFAARFGAGDYVDEESALTADDLNLMLMMLERVHANAKGAAER
jgi:hypothetical protein